MKRNARRRVYHPPESQDIEAAAASLRASLNRDSEFEDGFGNLLKAIAKAYANNLSRENGNGVLDNGDETS